MRGEAGRWSRRGLWIALAATLFGPAASRPVSAAPSHAAAAGPEARAVRTARAERVAEPVELTQTGTTRAFDTAALYPRATGYIAERRIDIGSHVRAGDLLFRISAPELDQQLLQAEAQIAQFRAALVRARAMVDEAEANRRLADVTNRRTSALAGTGAATQQNADTSQAGVLTQRANLAAAQAAVKVAEADIRAQEAQVARLKVLTGFEEIRAPFDGVITARGREVGDAVTADATTGPALATLARDDVLRVAVDVPLNAAEGVREGLSARVEVAQIPGKVFAGHVARSSTALLYASRTLVTQIDIPNPTRELRPGLYVTATLAIPRTAPVVRIPSDALIFDQGGTRVAVVEDGEGGARARLRTVAIARQSGREIELSTGLTGGERVVVGPPAGLRDGDRVAPRAENDKAS